MPPGSPYHSFALPYPIRVDNFTDTTDDLPSPYNRPALHLLTHTHSDHLTGLASKSFGHRIVCSPDAKEMLLRHEVYAERSLYDREYRAERTRTYGHLKIDPSVMPNGEKFYAASRDLLHAVPLNTPTKFELTDNETVTITLIDANHCPGAVMFLIEGPRGSILHTGDMRAESWFLSSLSRNPFLQPYLADSTENLNVFVARREGLHMEATGIVKTLEAVYLDTANLLSPAVLPSKEYAVQGLIDLIALFPSTTYFFLNCWTWGYEDILKGVARAFHCNIHLDRYKYSVYSCASDPLLHALGTQDASSTRFHACERFDRCPFVDVPPYSFNIEESIALPSKEGKKVVYVNPVLMGCVQWENYKAEVRRQLLRGKAVDSLLVPLVRHSPLPELMNFVSLFRPYRVIPNSLDPSFDGLDWAAMSAMFEGCVSPLPTTGKRSHFSSVIAPLNSLTSHQITAHLLHPAVFSATSGWECPVANLIHGNDEIEVSIKNLIGPSSAAERWADMGGSRPKAEMIKTWLGLGRNKSDLQRLQRLEQESDKEEMGTSALAQLNGAAGLSAPVRLQEARPTPLRTATTSRHAIDSDDSSDEGGSDDHARTAWKLFSSGIPEGVPIHWVSPSQSASQSQIGADGNRGERWPIRG
ncbi:beta-lactamase-like protein [Scleroderma citrinum]